MKNLELVLDVMSNEKELEQRAISSDYFALQNLLKLIQDVDNYDTNTYLAYIDSNTICFYKRISRNGKFDEYAYKIERVLMNHPLRISDVGELKIILEQLDFIFNKNENLLDNELVVKKLR